MKVQIYTILLTLMLFNVSCAKNIKSYMIGEWAVDSISYSGINYIDSMTIRQIDVSDNIEIMFPISTKFHPKIDFINSGWGKYYIVSEKEHDDIILETNFYELNGEHRLEIRNDTLRHYMLMIIKGNNLFIRAIRLNFTYDSPSGLKIVEDFEKWPKKGEYQFVPLPDSVLR